MKINYYSVLFFVIVFQLIGNAQNKRELQKDYEESLKIITDSTAQNNKLNQDTLFLQMDTSYREMVKEYYLFRDSVYSAYLKSLNIYRKDSVVTLAEDLKSSFDNFYKQKLDSLNKSYSAFVNFLNIQFESNINCSDCKEKSDFDDKLDDYRDLMDSLSGIFQDESSALADTLSYFCDDSLQGCKDSLLSSAQDLVDNQKEERGLSPDITQNRNEPIESVSELNLDVTYDSHESYRGRDNGFNQYSIVPSLQYIHKSGLGAFIDLTYLSKAYNKLDGIDVGISYQTDISDAFSLDFSYTHFWFSDSSNQSRASLNNNIEGILTLNSKHLNSSITIDMDFGNSTKEINTLLYGGLPLILSEHVLKGSITFEPGLTLIYGEQNSSLVQRRRLKRGVILKVNKTKSTFGIMDYELGFPLTLETNHLILKPVFYLIIPVNVLDLSTKNNFGDFSLEITVPFKF
jgi:hypothetical protein